MRHQFQYAGGIEIEAAPKVTLLVEFLGQHIMGGGQVVMGPEIPVTGASGITSAQSLVASDRHQQGAPRSGHQGEPQRQDAAVAERDQSR